MAEATRIIALVGSGVLVSWTAWVLVTATDGESVTIFAVLVALTVGQAIALVLAAWGDENRTNHRVIRGLRAAAKVWCVASATLALCGEYLVYKNHGFGPCPFEECVTPGVTAGSLVETALFVLIQSLTFVALAGRKPGVPTGTLPLRH